MGKLSSKYVCQNCGYTTLRWIGKCPDCSGWNTFVEEVTQPAKKGKIAAGKKLLMLGAENLAKVSEIDLVEEPRIKTSISELDRVLGGGIVNGSVILVGGDPGIGKSTLMLQLADKVKDHKILYVSGEESKQQIKMRCIRLGFEHDNFYILSETSLEIVATIIDDLRPDIVVIDSIQTVYRDDLESSPGSVSQLRECTSSLIKIAKAKSIAVFLIGHITKEGVIAGPKILEHMVDTVLQFEGERTHAYRVLRAIKNRFGSTNEIGIFEMTGAGLIEVANPSSVFISQRNRSVSGSAVSASIEGSRPILIEVQALVTSSGYSVPQRTTTGFDYKRLAILIAVLEKKVGLNLSRQDVFLNIAGGIRIEEPSIDLAAAMSIYSSFRNTPVGSDTIVIGEVGLGGEIRGVSFADRRVQEAVKLGFKKVILPEANMKSFKKNGLIDYLTVNSLDDAVKVICN